MLNASESGLLLGPLGVAFNRHEVSTDSCFKRRWGTAYSVERSLELSDELAARRSSYASLNWRAPPLHASGMTSPPVGRSLVSTCHDDVVFGRQAERFEGQAKILLKPASDEVEGLSGREIVVTSRYVFDVSALAQHQPITLL